jgi:hypothetical protein
MSDKENPEVQEETTEEKKSFGEELNVASNQLVKEVERLINEGNVRRLIIKQDDKVLLEVSLTLGVIGAGAVAIFAPWSAVILAAVAALAAAVARVTIVIERLEEGEKSDMEEPHA